MKTSNSFDATARTQKDVEGVMDESCPGPVRLRLILFEQPNPVLYQAFLKVPTGPKTVCKTA